MHKLMTGVAVALMGLSLVAAPKVSDATLLRMGPMNAEPVIDGVISDDEADRTSVQYGLASEKNGLYAMRTATAYFGWNDTGFYCAFRTSVPPPPQKRTAEDTVSLTLLPPGAEKSVDFTVCVADGSHQLPEGCLVKTRTLKGVTEYGVLCAETEMFIPYAAAKLPVPKKGQTWGLNMSATYSSEPDTVRWHVSKTSGELGTFEPDPAAPVVGFAQFEALESWRHSGNFRLKFPVYNPSAAPVTLASKSMIYRGVGVSKLDDKAETEDLGKQQNKIRDMDGQTVAAGAFAEYVHTEWNIWGGQLTRFAFDISAGDRPVYRRTIRLNYSGTAWKETEGLPSIKSAFFPSYGNRLRVSLDVNRTATLVKGEIRVIDAKDKVWFREPLKAAPHVRGGVVVDAKLGELPLGDYRVRFEASDAKGRVYTDERTFSVAKFPWQGLNLGKDRVIVPPFRPIRVEKGEKGKKGKKKIGVENRGTADDRISFLQTGYRCKGVLWDAVFAKGENILAAPITFKLNGQEFTVTGTKILEQAEDRVVREVTAVSGRGKDSASTGTRTDFASTGTRTDFASTVTLRVTQDYDYDGFCWTTFAFKPDAPLDVTSLQLEIPLQTKYVTLYDVLNHNDKRNGPATDFRLPTGEGEIWSSTNNLSEYHCQIANAPIQPYVFLGGPEKGFCWFIDSARNLSLDSKKSAERIIRSGATTTLVCDFVNVPTKWDATEKVYKMGFQPTPVKPQEWQYAAMNTQMYSYHCPSNAVYHRTGELGTFWALNTWNNRFPGDNDLSFVSWVMAQRKFDLPTYDKKLRAYVKRNADWFRKNRKLGTGEEYYARMRSEWRHMGAEYNIFYLDPELITCHWPEWEMYKAEWFILDWPWENLAHEYLGLAPATRIDKLLYDGLTALDMGYKGVYYDCFSNQDSSNFVCEESAYRRPDGTVQKSLSNMMDWRELTKRSAIMCYLNGGTVYNNRPVVSLHSTSHLFIPVASWCDIAVTTERGSAGGVYPIRFPEGYVLTEIVGRQCGAVPSMLVKAHGKNPKLELKSLMGFMCAYGLFCLSDQGIGDYTPWFDRAWNTVFDFGWGKPGVTPHYYYDEGVQPVTHTGKNVRLTVAEKKGKTALLLFGNLGEKDEDIAFDVSGLNLGAVKFADAETGKPLAAPQIRVEGYGHRMVLVTKP